ALFVLRRSTLNRAKRMTAGATQGVAARHQAVADGDALVEHETFALPAIFLDRHGFQVFQDAALEVIHLIEPARAQQRGGLFTPDAAGAEHCHLLAAQFGVALHPFRQLTETARGWI